jgi:hypothetical protein
VKRKNNLHKQLTAGTTTDYINDEPMVISFNTILRIEQPNENGPYVLFFFHFMDFALAACWLDYRVDWG